MAKKFLTHLDLSKNELQNAVIQRLASDPGSPAEGQIYYNTASDVIKYYDGTEWVTLGEAGAPPSYNSDDISNSSTVTGANVSDALDDHEGRVDSLETDSHTHANMSVLDNTTASFTTADETKLDGIEAGATKELFGGAAKIVDLDAGEYTVEDGVGFIVFHHSGTPADVDINFPDPDLNHGRSVVVFSSNSGMTAHLKDFADVEFATVASNDAVVATCLTLDDIEWVWTFAPWYGNNQDSDLGTLANGNSNTLHYHDSDRDRANHTGTQAMSTISDAGDLATLDEITTTEIAAATLVTESDTIASNDNDTTIPTSAAVKAYADSVLGANDAMQFKGGVDASANPNYPAADAGDTYKITVAGKIGGASGPNVEVGDTIVCTTDSTASGNHATVGANWIILQNNLDAATTSAPGFVELATTGEAEAKSDTARAVTPASLATFTRKYTATIGDNSSTSIAVTHGLGSQYVTAQVFEVSSGNQVECEITLTSGTQTTFTFAVAPTTNQYRVVVVG